MNDNIENTYAVAIIFYNRPNSLAKVFQAVANAKPKKLFLIQDGPRDIDKDMDEILACRKVVEHLNWECEVFRNYSEINLGCGKRVYSGVSWAFEHTEKLIVLEDDMLPASSLFKFCDDLLERYRNHTQICMISCMNKMDSYNCEYDYMFTEEATPCGWATWKHVWAKMNFTMSYFNDNKTQELLKGNISKYIYLEQVLKKLANRYQVISSQKKLTSWTTQMGMIKYMYSMVNIVPRVNMITYLGISDEGGEHSPTSLKILPREAQRILTLPSKEIDFPLNHPPYIMCDIGYSLKLRQSLLKKIFYHIERMIRPMLYEDKKVILLKIKNKLIK